MYTVTYACNEISELIKVTTKYIYTILVASSYDVAPSNMARTCQVGAKDHHNDMSKLEGRRRVL